MLRRNKGALTIICDPYVSVIGSTLRSIQSELLNWLCERASKESLQILGDSSIDSFKPYRRLYSHIKDTGRGVALCFDDWRRSTVFQQLMCIMSENLLTDEELRKLSQETQNSLQAVREFWTKR